MKILKWIKNLAILSIIILFFSCSKNATVHDSEPESVQSISTIPMVENNRLVFNSNADFYNFINEIDNGDLSKINEIKVQKRFTSLFDEMNKWLQSENDLPINLQSLQEMDLPWSFQRVLNPIGEVVIGKTIIWYNKGRKYFIDNLDENLLLSLKKDSNNKTVRSVEVGDKLMTVKIKIGGQSKTWMGLDIGPDARHQREFQQVSPPDGGSRKYVHEIQAYTDAYFNGFTYVWNSRVILRIKMEWRGRRWKPAGEVREMSYNLTCNNVFRGPSFGYEIPPNVSLTGNVTQSGDISRMIANTVGSGTFGSDSGWYIDVSGTIYQHVVSDIKSNEWYNTGYPLW